MQLEEWHVLKNCTPGPSNVGPVEIEQLDTKKRKYAYLDNSSWLIERGILSTANQFYMHISLNSDDLILTVET